VQEFFFFFFFFFLLDFFLHLLLIEAYLYCVDAELSFAIRPAQQSHAIAHGDQGVVVVVVVVTANVVVVTANVVVIVIVIEILLSLKHCNEHATTYNDGLFTKRHKSQAGLKPIFFSFVLFSHFFQVLLAYVFPQN